MQETTARVKMLLAAVATLLIITRCRAGSPIPASGVLLYSEKLGKVLPNNSLVASSDIGALREAIACYTAAGDGTDIPDDAVWEDLSGDAIARHSTSDSDSLLLFIQRRPKRIALHKGSVVFSSVNEGVYTCRINDERGDRQTLLIGVYTPTTVNNSAGPVVHSPVFSLLTNLTTHPSHFTITCPSSSTPPLSSVWSRDGDAVTVDGEIFETSQVLVNASTSRYDNVLSVSGDLVGVYGCEVGNDRGSSQASLTVRVPSGPPTDVQAEPGGGGTIRVSWTPPSGGSSGYVIVYRPSNSDQTHSVQVDDAEATSYIIESVMTETEYTVQMIAYMELSTSLSNSATVYLDVPDQPTNVVATPTSSSVVKVQWVGPQNLDDVDGYVIHYEPDVTVICEGVSGGEVTVEGAGVREGEVTGLEEGINYIIRVAALNSVGNGPFSDPPTAVYTLEEAPSGAPLNISVTPSSPTSLSVSWQPPDCLLWNSRLLTKYTLHYHPLPPSPEIGGEVSVVFGELRSSLTGLTSFTDYNVSISASNDEGTGPSSGPVFTSLVTVPGALEAVTYQPDILSLLISWDPPERGRGYITMVTLEHYNSGGVKLGSASVSNGETRHRLRDLQPLSSYNVTLTPHTSDPTPGPTHHLVASTIAIGRVVSVSVVLFNSTAVNVSWTPLPSLDVSSYTVYYTQLADADDQNQSNVSEMFVMFPAVKGGESGERRESGEGWGLVGRLEEGREYEFSVVAVVIVGDRSMQGAGSQPVRITTHETGGGGITQVIIIAGAAGALLILLIVVGVVIMCWLIRRYRRSGKMEVAVKLRPHRKAISPPNFDPPNINLASSQPEIVDAPTDIIAVEGEKVDFRLKVLGCPEPTVLWYHNGCMVGPDYATEISNDGGLTLVCVEANHEGTYRYTVSNCVGSIQGKVTLYVTSETSGWGQQQRVGMDLPRVTSVLVTVEQFPQYMKEKSENDYKALRDQYLCLNHCEENHSTSVALLDANKKYNRFLNIVPYDDNRVKLKSLSGREDCQHDYINASYIDGYGIARKFVATQGPTDVTVVDFWRMAWQLHCPTIVMMTNLEEGRKKCERYWPEFGTLDYGPYTVTLAEQKILADYTIRKLTLTSSFSSRHVHYITHYQFTSWPDHKVPEFATPLLEFHRKITKDHRPNKGPILLHCSAGVGRTGAFIVLDTALGQARGERRMDIPDILTRLRNQRMKLVQTPEQYIFLHRAVLEGLTCTDTRIEASQLEAVLAELSVHDPQLGCSGLEEEFTMLEAMTPHPKHDTRRTALQYPRNNGSMDSLHNIADQWRVELKDEQRYIQASFAGDYRQKHAFIISQAPMEETCRDFWKMVHERECGVIVMLSGLVEEGRVVCQHYWPTTDVDMYGEYAVTPLDGQTHDGFLERNFSVTDSKTRQTRYVSQLEVLDWNSAGKTSSPAGIVDCMVHADNEQRRNGDTPIVVHCSDSVTRSGIFCAAMAAMEHCRSEGVVDIYQAVRALRQQRPGAVPRVEHYKLLHELLLIFLQSNYSTYTYSHC